MFHEYIQQSMKAQLASHSRGSLFEVPFIQKLHEGTALGIRGWDEQLFFKSPILMRGYVPCHCLVSIDDYRCYFSAFHYKGGLVVNSRSAMGFFSCSGGSFLVRGRARRCVSFFPMLPHCIRPLDYANECRLLVIKTSNPNKQYYHLY